MPPKPPEIVIQKDYLRARLPATELGEDRCLEVGTPGHGDVTIRTWRGGIEDNVAIYRSDKQPDNHLKAFRLAHGSEALILSGLINYMRRIEAKNIEEVFLSAGKKAIEGVKSSRKQFNSPSFTLTEIANGKNFPRFDITQEDLPALFSPVPVSPGARERFTGMYTRLDHLVIAGLKEVNYPEFKTINQAEFVEADIPTLATLVCEIAKGEYQTDVASIIKHNFST